MIIFGTKTSPKVIGGSKKSCTSCKKKTVHGFVKVTEWFTLYFIPLIPVSKELLCICGACGNKEKIEGDAKKSILEAARGTA